jgi:hypothetical protein
MLRFAAWGAIVGRMNAGATWMSLLRFFPEVLW